MSTKTNKSYTKRLRVTKNGKIKARKPGFDNHLKSKKKRKNQLAAKVPVDFVMKPKDKARFMPHN